MKLKIFLFAILLTFSSIFATPTSITAPPVERNTVEKDDLKQFLGHCLHKGDVGKCLKNRIVEVIDEAIQSNDDWKMNFFNMRMSLKRNPEFKENEVASADESRTYEDVISQKLKSLMESRVFQVKLAENDDENEMEEARKKKGGKHGHSMMMMSGKY